MVEGNGLENRQAGNGLVGSNPTLSANVTYVTPPQQIQKVLTSRIPVHAKRHIAECGFVVSTCWVFESHPLFSPSVP